MASTRPRVPRHTVGSKTSQSMATEWTVGALRRTALPLRGRRRFFNDHHHAFAGALDGISMICWSPVCIGKLSVHRMGTA